MSGQPNRHARLVLWKLRYLEPLDMEITEAIERAVCAHARLDFAKWEQAKSAFPRWFENMLAARQRRLEYHRTHGAIPPRWTPPAPNGKTNRRPIEALAARRTMAQQRKARAAYESDRGTLSTYVSGKFLRALAIEDPRRRLRAMERAGRLILSGYAARGELEDEFAQMLAEALHNSPLKRST